MTSPTTYDAPTRPAATRALRLVALSGSVGGAALVSDTATITILNHNFGVLDDLLFWSGLLGLVVTLLALAAANARAARRQRVLWGIGTLVAGLVVIGALAQLMDTVGRHAFSPANIGLHGEWSFFTVGVCLLLIAGWARRSGHRPY